MVNIFKSATLESIGLMVDELAWFQSYLLNRKQFCRFNGVASPLENIDKGISQGSCLGPLLRPTSSQPRESVDSTIYCNANEFLHTTMFAGYRVLFV